MIRTNLATRPFYNQRAVNLWLWLAAALVLAVTLFNVSRVLRYSGSNTELVTEASQNEAAAAEARRNATQLRASVNVGQAESAARDARQANDLIDRRTFSWTELFNRFETTLPDDVRITAVSPTINREQGVHLTVTVLARTVDDVNQFMERLDATSVFRDLRSAQEHTNDDNQIESQLEMIYLPAAATPVATSGTPAPSADPAAPKEGQ
jgi:Tfp pilus assembly protein PilN